MADLPVRRGSSSSVGRWTRGLDPFERMKELMGFDPFEQMGRMVGGGEVPVSFIPAFEVKETKDAYVFKADVPGVKEGDLDITLTGDRLTISGKRETEQQEDTDRFYAYERSYGSFTRSFTLPEGVDPDHINADLKEGVLHLRLPKQPEMQPKRILVSSTGTNKQGKMKA
jgi:HSP20 family protein